MLRGVIVRGMGGLYTARTPAGEAYVLRCKKKFRRLGLSPLVGDEILFTPGEEEEHGWVEEILPRKTVCVRPPVANVELLLIVAAPVPAPDLLLVDRLLLGNDEVTMTVCLVVCLTVMFVVIFAKCVGCSLPLLAEKIGLDPAVMASPFITTIVDATSLLIYFALASAFLGI